MTHPNIRPTIIKRGGFAKDVRTGQIVVVKEHGRGDDVMVRTAYKTDGYWVGRADLIPAQDPHAWTGAHLAVFLLVLVVSAALGYHAFLELVHSGAGDTVAILDGAVPTGLISVAFLSGVLRLTRS